MRRCELKCLLAGLGLESFEESRGESGDLQQKTRTAPPPPHYTAIFFVFQVFIQPLLSLPYNTSLLLFPLQAFIDVKLGLSVKLHLVRAYITCLEIVGVGSF